MQKIELTQSDALLIYKEASPAVKTLLETKAGKEYFRPNIEDRILTFEDACEANQAVPKDVVPYSNPTDALQRSINAYAKLVQIVRAFNQGKVPDWKNANQGKYYPWVYMDNRSGSGLSFDDCAYVYSSTRVASRLCFLNSDHVKIAFERFKDIYEDYMTQ